MLIKFITSRNCYPKLLPKTLILGTPQSEARRKRRRVPSPARRTTRPRRQEVDVESQIVKMYSGRGIEGNRKIPVSHAVNTDNRVPDEIKSFGHRVIKLYLDALA